MSRKCAVIFLFPSPPLFPVNWQSFFYHPSFYFVGSETFPLHSLRKPCDTQNPPSPPLPPAKARNNDCSLSNINTTYVMSIMYLSVSSLW